ncbi:MAG TPA: HAMP domain-containing sensor histidine kinase, partial [Candidatus Saccharimonadales bacterium]|nr:HAMP domain-containing sensor histidine kinase [Candidatus Saccharimonadales bacterium]
DLRLLKIFGLFSSLIIQKNQQYTEIKKALDARDTFISLASHEIKTPLTTVYGYAQIIKRTLTAGKSPKLQWVNTLLFETHRVTLLVNELLQVEHVKTGKLNYRLKKCSLHLVIKRAMMDFAFIYPSHKLIFKNNLGKQPDFVQGDFDKLLQVILNILTNAGRFSSEKSTVRIALTHEKNYLIIKISDWGKGIEKKDLSRIFQRFYKADKTSKGLGLGLYLAKEVVDEHGGTIEINSKLGHGTAVTICLPKLKK